MKISRIILGTLLFVTAELLFLYALGMFSPKEVAQIEAQHQTSEVQTVEKQPIQTQGLQQQEITLQREFSATVVADQKAILATRLTATIAEVLVDVGAQVKQGDVLVRLQNNDLDARVIQMEQALSSTQAQLNVARKEYQRAQTLIDKKLISQSQFDQAQSQLKSANANFIQAQATLSEAQTSYGYSIISAPFDGVVATRAINVGDTATPGMHLLSLYNPKSLQLEVSISESLLNKATLGSMLNYQIPSLGIEGQGSVVEVSPATDSTSRSFLLKVTLPPIQSAFPGNYARVWVESEKAKQLIVPSEAVYQVGQLDYVKVLEEGKVKIKLVQLGDDYQVRKGLKEGDQVVINPLALN